MTFQRLQILEHQLAYNPTIHSDAPWMYQKRAPTLVFGPAAMHLTSTALPIHLATHATVANTEKMPSADMTINQEGPVILVTEE